jgi:regulator of RNase E activity RraB
MSESWEVYLRRRDGEIGSVLFDQGISEVINQMTVSDLLKVRVNFKSPRPDGFPSSQEFDLLEALEDSLASSVDGVTSHYVGRITANGERVYYVYTQDEEATWSARLDAIEAELSYSLLFSFQSDPAKDGYWKELLPTEEEWRIAQDMKVLDALAEAGDDGVAIRQIDHWAFFNSESAAQEFSTWAAKAGYAVDGIHENEDGSQAVRFNHQGSAQLSDITQHTKELQRQVNSLGGDYDGWETEVCRSSQS